jgi:hypothetical protein
MSDSDLPEGFRREDPTAHDQATTDACGVSFSVKESAPIGNADYAQPWLMIELDGSGLPVLKAGDSFLGLSCRYGTTIQEAEQLARDMNRLLSDISHTKFIT